METQHVIGRTDYVQLSRLVLLSTQLGHSLISMAKTTYVRYLTNSIIKWTPVWSF